MIELDLVMKLNCQFVSFVVTILLGGYFIESTGERENEILFICGLTFSLDLIASQNQLQVFIPTSPLYFFFLQNLQSYTDPPSSSHSSSFSSYLVTDPLGRPEEGRKAVQLLPESKEKNIKISSSIKSGTHARKVP